LAYRNNQLADLTVPVGTHQHRADLNVTPPAGKTILASSSYRIVQLDGPWATDALLGEASFDAGLVFPPGWIGSTSVASIVAEAGAPDGPNTMRIIGDGVLNNPNMGKWIPAIPGATYQVSGYARRVAGTLGARIALDSMDAAGVTTFNRVALDYPNTQTTWLQKNAPYTVPADGSVAQIRWRAQISGVAAATDDWRFDRGRLDPQGAGVVISSGPLGAPAAGGGVSLYGTVQAGHASNGTRWRVDVTVNDSGGGVAAASRTGIVAYGEWFGSVALGDGVTKLSATPVVKSPLVANSQVVAAWYRAQSSPSAAAGSATWRTVADAALVAELPATNAYLGLRERLVRRAAVPNLIANGSFEVDTSGWSPSNAQCTIGSAVNANAVEGSKALVVTGTASASNSQTGAFGSLIPVLPGATYRFSAWVGRGNQARTGRLRLGTYDAAGVAVNATAATADKAPAAGAMEYVELFYTIPADGTVAQVRLTLFGVGMNSGDTIAWDVATFYGPAAVSVEGLDKLTLAWTSLG